MISTAAGMWATSSRTISLGKIPPGGNSVHPLVCLQRGFSKDLGHSKTFRRVHGFEQSPDPPVEWTVRFRALDTCRCVQDANVFLSGYRVQHPARTINPESDLKPCCPAEWAAEAQERELEKIALRHIRDRDKAAAREARMQVGGCPWLILG